jgi:hypothetical protein
MVITKGVTEQYEVDEATKSMIEDVLWQKAYDEKEIKQVRSKLKNIKGGTAEKTIAAYDKAFKEKGLIAEGPEDYPRDQFIQLKYLTELTHLMNPFLEITTYGNNVILVAK